MHLRHYFSMRHVNDRPILCYSTRFCVRRGFWIWWRLGWASKLFSYNFDFFHPWWSETIEITFPGPPYWGDRYQECRGKHQSPININILRVKQVALPDIAFIGFDDPIDDVHVTNNGHTGNKLYRLHYLISEATTVPYLSVILKVLTHES